MIESIEEFFANMTKEELKQSLIDADFEYYSKFKCFCPLYNIEEGCSWTPELIEFIDCCPADRRFF